MKRILIAALAVATLTSCSFIRIDTKALKALLVEEGVDMTVESKSVGRMYTPNGVATTQLRGDLEEFHAIESVIPIDIEYSQGEQFVEITASSNIMPFIATTVHNGTLKLYFKGIRVKKANKDMKVIIKTPKLDAVTIEGAGDLELKGQINADDLRIGISGAGDVDIDDLIANEFIVKVSGAGDLDADKLTCNLFDVDVSGAGDIDVEALEADRVNIKISGSGDATLAGHARTGDFSVSGAGAIDIKKLSIEDYDTSMSGMAKLIR